MDFRVAHEGMPAEGIEARRLEVHVVLFALWHANGFSRHSVCALVAPVQRRSLSIQLHSDGNISDKLDTDEGQKAEVCKCEALQCKLFLHRCQDQWQGWTLAISAQQLPAVRCAATNATSSAGCHPCLLMSGRSS